MDPSIANLPRNLPNDVISNILSRIPTKALTRCKTLSKFWYRFIRSSFFARAHMQQMRMQNRVYVRLQQEARFVPLQMIPAYNGGKGHQRLFYPVVPRNEYVATCNGFVVLVNMQDEIQISNPCTRQYLMLPWKTIPYPPGCTGGCVFFGLGYSETQDDYKFVRISRFNQENGESMVEVYSRNHHAWYVLGPYPHTRPVSCPGIFVCGRLHWLLSQDYQVTEISALDVTDLTFSTISLPRTPPRYDIFYELSSLNNETLILFSWIYAFDKPIDVWMLKDYFNNESWFYFSINMVPPFGNINRFVTVQPLFLVEPSKKKLMIRVDPIGVFGFWHIEERMFQLIQMPLAMEPHLSSFFKIIDSIECPWRNDAL